MKSDLALNTFFELTLYYFYQTVISNRFRYTTSFLLYLVVYGIFILFNFTTILLYIQ